jgi:hypothetical protein
VIADELRRGIDAPLPFRRQMGSGSGILYRRDSKAQPSRFIIFALAMGLAMKLSNLFSYTYTKEKDEYLFFNNIYRLSRALFSCPLFSYTSLDLPSFLGSPFFPALLAPGNAFKAFNFNKLSFWTDYRKNA